jgi:DNA invertase Pin-like site-specific DNA recombinase
MLDFVIWKRTMFHVGHRGTLYLGTNKHMEAENREEPKLIPYYRVSTAKQGRSGLGLEGQQAAVKDYARRIGGKVLTAYKEVETGKRSDRPELAKAMALCTRCQGTLVIAKLDRLSRNLHFLSGLMESGVDFVCCDMPAASRFTLHIMAAVAEMEAKQISERTKAALAAAKARGVLLGSDRPGAHRLKGGANPKAARRAGESARANREKAYADVAGDIRKWHQEGASFRDIAGRLNDQGKKTRRQKPWYALQVKRVFDRIKPV